MKTPTAEQLRAALPTDAQVDDIVSRISSGKLRRCIPVQVDDDDILIANALEDWKRIRKFEPRIRDFHFDATKNETKATVIAQDFSKYMAGWMAGAFGEAGATNYVEWKVIHDETRQEWICTIQKGGGKTPHELRTAAEALLELAVRGCLDPGGDEPFREFIVKLAEWREANPEPARTR